VAGIHATGALTARRLEQGFTMITVTSDAVALRHGLTTELATARQPNPTTPGSTNLY